MDYMLRFKINGGPFQEFANGFENIAGNAWFESWIPIHRKEKDGEYFDCYLFCVSDIEKIEDEIKGSFDFDSRQDIDVSKTDMSCVKADALAYKYLIEVQKKTKMNDFEDHLYRHFFHYILNSLGYGSKEEEGFLRKWAEVVKRFREEQRK